MIHVVPCSERMIVMRPDHTSTLVPSDKAFGELVKRVEALESQTAARAASPDLGNPAPTGTGVGEVHAASVGKRMAEKMVRYSPSKGLIIYNQGLGFGTDTMALPLENAVEWIASAIDSAVADRLVYWGELGSSSLHRGMIVEAAKLRSEAHGTA